MNTDERSKDRQSQPATMDPEVQKKWDEWARSIVRDHCDTVVDVIGEEVGKDFRLLSAENRKLCRSVSKLRAELTLMRGDVIALSRHRAKSARARATAKLAAGHRR